MTTIFKKVVINLGEPICLCAEQRLAWNIVQTGDGPSLLTWCQSCGTRLQVPNKEFKAVFQLDRGYPGRGGPRIEEVPPGVDLADFLLHRKRAGPPS